MGKASAYLGGMNFPWTTRTGQFSWLKASILALCLLPGLLGLYWLATGAFGALPIKAAMKYFGLWSLRFLLVTLALTPLQRLVGLGKLALVRRMLGVTAASYAGIHFALFVPFMGWSFVKIFSEITSRVYLMFGAAALIALLLLAFTSTDGWISRLGQNWKKLHRLVYPLALLALVHMALQEKIDATASLQLLGVFVLLMTYRILLALRLQSRNGALLAATVAAALATIALEALWYASLSGISPLRVIAANWTYTAGLRPAQLVLLVGISVMAIAVLRSSPLRLKPAFLTR